MKSSITQYVVIAIFIIFAIAAVIIFSVAKGTTDPSSLEAKVTIWGTMPEDDLFPVIASVNTETPGRINLDYVEKTEAELEEDLTNALLDDAGIPDGLLIPHTLLLKYQKRLTLIAWTALSERDLKTNYAEAGEVFFTPNGTYGVPFLIDPLVLYWNRDIFNSQAISKAPSTWQELLSLVSELTELNPNRTVRKSAIALGEYQNIPHAKEILSALSLQTDGRFTARTETGVVSEVHRISPLYDSNPLEAALLFYTQFADPANRYFAWSRALPDALTMFLQGDSAMYIGFGSEADDIRAKNPNLNFDIAYLPQPGGEDVLKRTYGTVYGLTILNESPYKDAMLKMALLLTSSDLQKEFAEYANRAPARRDLLATPPGTGVADIVWGSAFWTRGWLDPNPTLTSTLFRTMIEGVTTGRFSVAEAVLIFGDQLKELTSSFQ